MKPCPTGRLVAGKRLGASSRISMPIPGASGILRNPASDSRGRFTISLLGGSCSPSGYYRMPKFFPAISQRAISIALIAPMIAAPLKWLTRYMYCQWCSIVRESFRTRYSPNFSKAEAEGSKNLQTPDFPYPIIQSSV